MIGSHHSLLTTEIASPRLRSWLVLAVLFAPYKLLVTPTTHTLNGSFENLFGFLGLGVVHKGKHILMGWGSALLLLFGTGLDRQRHGVVISVVVGVVRNDGLRENR